jgi:pilus assembly protein Flp/PilA
MMAFFNELWRDEKGAMAIEYALIAALISTMILTAITQAGTQLTDLFNSIARALQVGGDS